MSYDFQLFKPRPGEDPHVTAQREADDDPTTPIDPQKEALKRRVADALIAHNPKLEIFQFDYDQIAKHRRITVEEACRTYRHVELNGPEDDPTGIQITLFDDEASLTVPYWHDDDVASNTFQEIWSYLEIIGREAGYLIYDPQTDSVLDPTAGFDDALACYSGVTKQIHKAIPTSHDAASPWWKFWDRHK